MKKVIIILSLFTACSNPKEKEIESSQKGEIRNYQLFIENFPKTQFPLKINSPYSTSPIDTLKENVSTKIDSSFIAEFICTEAFSIEENDCLEYEYHYSGIITNSTIKDLIFIVSIKFDSPLPKMKIYLVLAKEGKLIDKLMVYCTDHTNNNNEISTIINSENDITVYNGKDFNIDEKIGSYTLNEHGFKKID